MGTKSYAYLLVRVILKDAALGRLAVLQKDTPRGYGQYQLLKEKRMKSWMTGGGVDQFRRSLGEGQI